MTTTTTLNATAAQDLAILKAARERLDAGWVKGAYQAPGGEVCIRGAIFAVTGGEPRSVITRLAAALPAAWHGLRFNLGPEERVLIAFNDHNQTDKADVLALFDRAIAKLQPTQVLVAAMWDRVLAEVAKEKAVHGLKVTSSEELSGVS